MREYRFTVTEHDSDQPWLAGRTEHHTAELEDDANFFKWAAEQWPRERFTVQLDPWQLEPADAPTDCD